MRCVTTHTFTSSSSSTTRTTTSTSYWSRTSSISTLGPDSARLTGKYMVQSILGRGGVGTVHKGHDTDLGRDVAMKFLHKKYQDEPAILQRFVEEA